MNINQPVPAVRQIKYKLIQLSIGATAKRRGRSTALKLLNEPCMAELAPSFCMPD